MKLLTLQEDNFQILREKFYFYYSEDGSLALESLSTEWSVSNLQTILKTTHLVSC